MRNPCRNWRYKHKQTGEIIQFDFFREPPKPYQFTAQKSGETIRMEPEDLEQYDRINGKDRAIEFGSTNPVAKNNVS